MILAIIAAFVGGMIFAGTPVEAKKGGGGDIIDEIWATISSLDSRVTQNESDIDNLEKAGNVAGVIIGKAFYEGTIDLKNVFKVRSK